MNNWVRISEEALLHNFGVLRRAAGAATDVLAVVKANAYGHGAEVCARVLAGAGAATWLGVTSASEGARVREAVGPGVRILVMCGFLPEDAPLLREHGLTPIVWTPEQVGWLGGGLAVHVEVDTGMSRQGVLPGGVGGLVQEAQSAGLEVEGIFTHFSASEERPEVSTLRQQRLFEEAVRAAVAAGARPRWVHAGNSSTLDNPAGVDWLPGLAAGVGARAMVRTGLALYGYTLPTAHPRVKAELRPVLSWHTRVLAVRELAAGTGWGTARLLWRAGRCGWRCCRRGMRMGCGGSFPGRRDGW